MSKSRDWCPWRSRIVIPHLTRIRNSSDGFIIHSLNTVYGLYNMALEAVLKHRKYLTLETASILKFHRLVKLVCNISIYLMWFEMTRTAPKWSRLNRRRPRKPTENQKLNPFRTYSEISDCEPPGCVSASDLRLTFNSTSEITSQTKLDNEPSSGLAIDSGRNVGNILCTRSHIQRSNISNLSRFILQMPINELPWIRNLFHWMMLKRPTRHFIKFIFKLMKWNLI